MKKTVAKDKLSDIVGVLGKVICSDELSSKNNIILMDAFDNIKKVVDEIN